MLNNIVHARNGGAVKRCHTIRHIGEYNNAMHQWNVTMLLWYLFPEDFSRLSIYCLTHDLGEAVMGDIPASVKWAMGAGAKEIEFIEDEVIKELTFPVVSDLEYEDMRKIKACDALELYIWCLEQLQLGNLFVLGCKQNLEGYFRKGWLPTPALNLYHELVQRGLPLSTQDGTGLKTVKA